VITKGFYKPSEDSKEKDVYLEFEEIQRIIDLELNDKLSNARDWFVIGLNSGLRVSDLLKLNELNIQGNNLIVTTQKTKTPIAIPIMSQVDEVIKRRNGFPRKLSDQKFNEYIKEVCRLAQIDTPTKGSKRTRVEDPLKRRKHGYTTRKIDGVYPKYELVTSHTCRRSFASNYYGKIPTAIIRAITGHSSEREFLNYIQVSPEEHARNFMEHVKNGVL
jgi:integrase